MTLFHWSKTAASNGAADITCPWPEGMGAPAINDSARGMMAAVAKFRDDISGGIVTTGSAGAYSVSSYEGYGSYADLDGKMIAFTPHATNTNSIGADVTINVDGLGARLVRSAPGAQIFPGALILGAPYVAVYNAADAVFYLHGSVSNAYDVPIGGTLLWWDAALPSNGLWAWANGQIIANANIVCPILLGRWGSRFGGNGATTMGVPDTREVMPIGVAGMGGTTSRAITSYTGWNVIGTVFGTQNNTLAIGNMPSHDHGGLTGTDSPDHVHGYGAAQTNGVTYAPNAGSQTGFNGANGGAGTTGGASARHVHGIPAQGSAVPLNNMPPSVTCGFILRLA